MHTDLAIEIKEMHKLSENDGFSEEEFTTKGITVSRVKISGDKAAEQLNKKKGEYITIDLKDAFSDTETHTSAVDVTASEIEKLIYQDGHDGKEKSALVVGLGNKLLTSDSVGPKAIENLLVTRHIKEHMPELFKTLNLNSVSALIPGVLGQTGIETFEIVKSTTEKIKPDVIIVVDALASRRMNRLCRTIQISNTGICPGSGVGNKRDELSQQSLGIPVISIGIPTVVDAATLTADTIELALEKIKLQLDENNAEIIDAFNAFEENDGDEIIRDTLSPFDLNLIVTPKDIDRLMEKCARLLGLALNKALHGGLEQEEINALLGL